MAVRLQKRFQLGEFELEVEKCLLLRRGEQVSLPELPFRVLLYLVEQRDRYVSRRELLERFWDGHDSNEEALTKCVSTIRAQLCDPPAAPRFIETRKKVGYRFVGPVEELTPTPAEPAWEIERVRGARLLIEEEVEAREPAPVLGPSADVGAPELPPAVTSRPARFGSRGAALLAAGLLLVLVLAALLFTRARTGPATPAAETIRSVAIIPLRNLSGDRGEEFFSDGLTESLITALSQLEELQVISRAAAFRYKSTGLDPQELGRQMGVAAVLEGGVRQDGDAVRVSVRLVSTADGRVLWAKQSYERRADDIFGLQDEIARDVVAGLRLTLSGKDERMLTRHYTADPEAYRLFLKGRFHWNQMTREAEEESIKYYRLAIERDPNYALAYAGLADSYVLLAFDYLSPREVLPLAKEAAAKALALDGSLAEAHISMGAVKLFLEWDWDGAAREARRATEFNASYRKAIELNTGYGDGHHFYCTYLDAIGRADESIKEIQRALELDPYSRMLGMELGWSYYNDRQYDAAVAECRRVLAEDKAFIPAYLPLAMALEQKGQYGEAIAALEYARTLPGSPPAIISELGYAYAAAGRTGEAEGVVRELKARATQEFIDPYFVAIVYLGLRDDERTFEWLERAYQEHSISIVWLNIEPKFDRLRPDPRFDGLLRRVGLKR